MPDRFFGFWPSGIAGGECTCTVYIFITQEGVGTVDMILFHSFQEAPSRPKHVTEVPVAENSILCSSKYR